LVVLVLEDGALLLEITVQPTLGLVVEVVAQILWGQLA
jgi:hypothetical protein